MKATILLNKNGFDRNKSEVGELITSTNQCKLYYDAGVGLYYRNNNHKVETLATKVDDYDFKKIRNEISKFRTKKHTVATINVCVRLR